MMSKTAGWALVAGVALFGAAACSTVRGEPELRGWVTTTTVADDGGSEAGPAPTVEVAPGDVAPAAFAFAATDLDGAPIAGTELYARRPLVMSFVVPTCPVCVTEASELAAAARRRPDVGFVIVHSGGDAESYRGWIDAADVDGTNVVHVVDDELALWHRFGVTAQPSTVLVAADGTLRTVVGALGESGLDRAAGVVTGVSG